MWKKALAFLVAAVLLLGIIFHELVVYGFYQGVGQANILLGSKPIARYKASAELTPEMLANLNMIPGIKKFGMEKLGLDDTKNYTKVYDQKGQPVLWVVSACEPYRFKSKIWDFPFVGTVSYKGYFRLDKTLKLRDELKANGLDTYVREVGAWSTLGWFKDPLMSESLKDSVGEFANTLLHELTHATVFVKDSLEFNENLASFIGDKGAEDFVRREFGYTSEEFRYYVEKRNDRGKYVQHLIRGAKALDSLYATFEGHELDLEDKETLKYALIRGIINDLDTIRFAIISFENHFKETLPNNAYFSSFLLYRSMRPQLDSIYQHQFSNNLKEMVNYFKKHHGK